MVEGHELVHVLVEHGVDELQRSGFAQWLRVLVEADEQAVHLWQHVGGEERDGDGVPVFEVEPHIRWQVGAHLLKRVSVAGFEP